LGLKQTAQPTEAQRLCDPETALEIIIGDKGRIVEEYGGYLIVVQDQITFPWADVFRILLRIGHAVWVEARDGRVVIVSKPEAD